MDVYVPGVLKLLGEYQVIWGGTAVAVAVNSYAKATIDDLHGSKMTIILKDFNDRNGFIDADLRMLYGSYKAKPDLDRFVKIYENYGAFLPYAVIAARLENQYEVEVKGKRIAISSQIPEKSGYASSTACFMAFTTALLATSDIRLPAETIIDVTRDGERILSRSVGAGRIDVSTSYYGGCVSYNQANGAVQEPLNSKLPLVAVNTGAKPPTRESIEFITKKKYAAGFIGIKTNETLEKINSSAVKGLAALRKGDKKELGDEMQSTHMLLRDLGVSNNRLDSFVEVSMKNGAYGAKLSGSGRGGAALAIVEKEPSELAFALRKSGFTNAEPIEIAAKGASRYLTKERLKNSLYF